jgi:hypothetical protein
MFKFIVVFIQLLALFFLMVFGVAIIGVSVSMLFMVR